jgi:5-methylcytosine-specific restriction enzyme A
VPSRPDHYCGICRRSHGSACPKRKPYEAQGQHRGSRHARGYGTRWERIRRQVLARDDGICQECSRQGIATPAHAVDHIRPKAHGGTDDMDNLQSLCKRCHAVKTAAESNRARM